MPPKRRRKRRHKKRHKKSKKKTPKPNQISSTISSSNSPSIPTPKTKTKSKSKSTIQPSKRPKDLNQPKRTPSSYFLFCNDIRNSLKQQYPNKTMPQLSKLMSTKWNEIPNKQKKETYGKKANILRNEWKKKIKQYRKTKSYKDFQQKLKQWKSENTNTNNRKSYGKRGKKRKRNKNKISHSDKESSLSSLLSDNDQIFSQKPNKKRRKIMNSNSNNNNDDLSSELSEEFDGIMNKNRNKNNDFGKQTIFDVIKNGKKCGKEMASTIKEREKQMENDNNDNNNGSDNENEDEKNNNNNNEAEIEILSCRDCERIFSDNDLLILHEKKIHKYKCKFCNLSFLSEGKLEEHIYSKHDAFDDNNNLNNNNYNGIRIDENGEFQINDNNSKHRWIHNKSKNKQQKRMLFQMNKMKKQIIIKQNNNHKGIVFQKPKKKINTQSYNKSKRNNIGLTYSWTKQETERFYKVLKLTAANFTFMETVYNKAIKMDKDSKWRYRDARMLKKKYKQEEKHNSEKLTEICHNVKFDIDKINFISETVKKNEFKLKDEKYFKDSDIESDSSDNINDENNDDESEEEFNPLKGYKEEIERDKEFDRQKKRKEMEKLEAHRSKKSKLMKDEFDTFKKEMADYAIFKAKKEGSGGVDGDVMQTDLAKHINGSKNSIMDDDEEDEGDMDQDGGFNPFDDLIDVESDDGVGNGKKKDNKIQNGYDSDRSVSKNLNKNVNVYGGHDDGYEYDGYDDGYNNEDFDIDGDPFV